MYDSNTNSPNIKIVAVPVGTWIPIYTFDSKQPHRIQHIPFVLVVVLVSPSSSPSSATSSWWLHRTGLPKLVWTKYITCVRALMLSKWCCRTRFAQNATTALPYCTHACTAWQMHRMRLEPTDDNVCGGALHCTRNSNHHISHYIVHLLIIILWKWEIVVVSLLVIPLCDNMSRIPNRMTGLTNKN